MTTVSANWHFAIALMVGGITAGLPLVFLRSVRLSAKKLFLAAVAAFLAAVVGSALVSMGGACSFTDTLFMVDSGCNLLPLLNSRTVPVFLILSLTCTALFLVALVRDLVLWVGHAKQSKG
jgi:hypothetical protein